MSDQTFEIGLCMAGAVSAGAYTAGVIDYLIEALDEWEKKREENGVPKHRVVIKIIGGASAGGMTGIITASAINNPITPIREATGDLMQTHPENKLYHSWVDLMEEDMFPRLLKNDDIVDGKIYSLLNSNFIYEIAERAVKVESDWIERKYFDNHLKFFTTLTNLKGLRYNTGFKGNLTSNDYWISRHNDYATFKLNHSQSDYDNDGWIPVSFKTGDNVEVARDCAMATGAFPVGLRSRQVVRDGRYVNDHEWHKDITKHEPVPSGDYKTLNVDGGTINNEPFMRVKSLLTGVDPDFDKFKATVLQIDPFPSEAEKFNVEKDGLFDVIGGTLSAMIGHLRTKPEVLEENLFQANASQFQIAPRRAIDGEVREGSRAIACGFLGGFGGFLNKEFRIHDFFLGRANCERFLREHFTVPIDTSNDIFKEGYDGIPNDQFVSEDGKRRQIIPVLKQPQPSMYMPTFAGGKDWPVREKRDVNRFKKPLKRRAGKIIMNLSQFNFFQRVLIGIGNLVILRGKLAGVVLDTIKESMREHKLLP